MHLWTWLVAALLVLAAPTAGAAAPALHEAARCLGDTGRMVAGNGVWETFAPPAPLVRDRLAADARGRTLRPSRRRPGDPRYAIAFAGSDNCWIGGRIVGEGGSASLDASALALGTGHPTTGTEVHSLTVRKTRSGILAGQAADDLRLTNLRLDRVAEACLIAKQKGRLVVDGAFFNRCGRVATVSGDHPGSTLVIRDSLIRIDNGRRRPGSGRLFDRASADTSMRVLFRGNTVVTARPIEAGSLSLVASGCRGNTLIWLGAGGYPGDLPACFTVVTGKDAWREARRHWRADHERRLAAFDRAERPGVAAPRGSTCTVPSPPSDPGPRKVVGDGSGGSCTEAALRRALDGGGTITFACGRTPTSIPISSELTVSSPTVIDGGGRITLDGQDRTRILKNDSTLILRGITLAGGRFDYVWDGVPNGGGAVKTSYGNRLYVVDSTFRDNWTSEHGSGGAIFQAGRGSLTVVRSLFEGNTGGGGGAIYNLLAGLRVVHSRFERNVGSSGRKGGGGIMTDGASADSHSGGSGGEIALCGSTFKANEALATGGGAYLFAYPRDRVTVRETTFAGNGAIPNDHGLSMGGGLRLGDSPAVVAGSVFKNNGARMGGAIATQGERPTEVRNSTFRCNSSDVEGGNVRATGNDHQAC